MMAAHVAGISVVVPVHGRVPQVVRLLVSLARARNHWPGPSEIVVVDSSPAEQGARVADACVAADARVVRAPNQVATKRNLGAAAARHEVVLFVDSDCEVGESLLREHAEAHTAAPPDVAAFAGVTRWLPDDRLPWPGLRFAPSLAAAFRMASWRRDLEWATCTNLSVRKDAFDSIGGFDTSLPLVVYGEDVDLGLRLSGSGRRILGLPESVVWHASDELTGVRAWTRKAWRTGRADVHLGIRHPKRLQPDFPRPLGLAVAIGILATMLGGHGAAAFAPAVWLATWAACVAVLSACVERSGVRSVPGRLVSLVPALAFQAGRAFEALLHRRPERLVTRFLYVPEQVAAERSRCVLEAWSSLAATMATAAFCRVFAT